MKTLLVAILSFMVIGCAYPPGTRWGSEDAYNETVDCTADVLVLSGKTFGTEPTTTPTRIVQKRVVFGKVTYLPRTQMIVGWVGEKDVYNLQCK